MVNDPRHPPDFGDRTALNTVTFIVLVFFHIGAVAAPFFFSWSNLLAAAAVYWVALSWGIGMGYHRLHTHRGYKAPKWLERFLAVCGTLALEGGPIYWVATHRCHHQYSDTDCDPHTPRHGGFWAHMGWIMFGKAMHNNTKLLGKYAPDLQKEKFYRVLNEWHWVPLMLSGFAFLAFGGLGMMLWAVPLRVVVGLHATWLVNSATHMWGSRRFATTDDSRNLWWGRAADVRRGLAQQPPRASGIGASRHGLVRVGLGLSADPPARNAGSRPQCLCAGVEKPGRIGCCPERAQAGRLTRPASLRRGAGARICHTTEIRLRLGRVSKTNGGFDHWQADRTQDSRNVKRSWPA